MYINAYLDGWAIYQYTLNTAWDISSASYTSKSYTFLYAPGSSSFSTDGTKLYIVGNTDDMVHQYTLGTAWDISTATDSTKNCFVGTEISTPHELALNSDGTKMYIAGDSETTIHQYNFGTAWDVSTTITTTTQLIGLPNHNSIHLINHHSIIYTESINMSHISRYKCTHTVSVTFTVRWLA